MKIIETITEHFKKKDASISVIKGSKKLQKPTSHNKFNWTKEDVLNDSGSIKDFWLSLPEKGFGDGSEIFFKIKNGSTHIIESIESFDDNTVIFTEDSKCLPIEQVSIMNIVESYSDLCVNTINEGLKKVNENFRKSMNEKYGINFNKD